MPDHSPAEESPDAARSTSASGRALASEIERRVGVRFSEGNDLELVLDGAVFDAMDTMIRAARRSIELVMYIWREGEASDRVVSALIDRVRAGVRCRILVDPFGSRIGFSSVRRQLEDAGCEVRTMMRRGREFDVAEPFARSHRKLLVCDGADGLAGGWCIWDPFLGRGGHDERWRDTNVRVRGPVVATMAKAFADQWRDAGGEPFEPAPPSSGVMSPGRSRAAFVASGIEGDPTPAEALTRLLIERATTRLFWAVGYFVPEPAIVDRLVRRAEAGVDVRLIVPGSVHDVTWVKAAQRSAYAALLRAGVAIYEYQPAMMHAKTVVVDGELGVVGSIDAEPMSQRVLAEDAVVFLDEALTAQLASVMERDLAQCERVRRAPSRWVRWLGWLLARLDLWVARTVHALRRP